MRVFFLVILCAGVQPTAGAAVGAFIRSTAGVLGIVNGGIDLYCWASRCDTDTTPQPPPFSGAGNYWRSRQVNKAQALCSGRVKIEVPASIFGQIPYTGDKWDNGETPRNWTVRLGRGRYDLTKNSGASGSYKRIRYVRGSKNSSCLNANYPRGHFPPRCYEWGQHSDYWSGVGAALQGMHNAFSNMFSGIFGNSRQRTVHNQGVGGPMGVPDDFCTNENVVNPPSAHPSGEYDRSINGGYGHPMCDDEHLGYENDLRIPCRTGMCNKANQETIFSVYKDELQGLDAGEDSEAPDEFFIFALGTQEYRIGFDGVGYQHNMANDHERLIPQPSSTERIQIKRVSHATMSRQSADGYQYVRNVYPNHSMSISFWEKIIGQAHRNTRWSNYDNFLTEEVGGHQWIQHPDNSQTEVRKNTRFCRREDGHLVHHTGHGVGDFYQRYALDKCNQGDCDAGGSVEGGDCQVWGLYPDVSRYRCTDVYRDFNAAEGATERDFCIQNAPDWPGGFNLDPEANEDAPTEAYSDYEGCPEDAPEWYFYVCLEDAVDADGRPDCETRPRTMDHTIRWVARKDQPSANAVQEVQQDDSTGRYESYPFVIPMTPDEAAYPDGTELQVEEYVHEDSVCFSASVTWWERPTDRNTQATSTARDCSFFDKRDDEGSIIQSRPPYTDKDGQGNFDPTIYDGTNNINGSIMPGTILTFDAISNQHIHTGSIFPQDPAAFVGACCGLGGGTIGTAAPTIANVPPPPTPEPCFDRIGTFNNVLNLDGFDHTLGCATLYNPTGTTLSLGSVSVQPSEPIYTWLCDQTALRNEVSCSDDDILNGDCTPAESPGNTAGLQVSECCACGGNVNSGRTEPFTYSPTTTAPTAAPTTCADAFSLIIPFFHDRAHNLPPTLLPVVEVHHPTSGNLIGYDRVFNLEFVPMHPTATRFLDPYRADQGDICTDESTTPNTFLYGNGENCSAYFPLANPQMRVRLQAYQENGRTALENGGRRFNGANNTFRRTTQFFNQRPVFEVETQSDLFNRHVIAYVNDRWVLSPTAGDLLDVDGALAFTAESDLCPETSTWVTMANMEHGASLRTHPISSGQMWEVLMVDNLYVEWPFNFQVITDTPDAVVPVACLDELTVTADQLENGLLWAGSVRGAFGTYYKTTELRNSRPVWAHSNFTDYSNWHIYHTESAGVGRWVIDDDNNAANGHGYGAYSLSDVNCPEDLLSRRRQTEEWIITPQMYGGITGAAPQSWTSLRVAADETASTTATTASTTAASSAEDSESEDDDNTVYIAVGAGVGGVLLIGLAYSCRKNMISAPLNADFSAFANLL
jgi:hypothetical protein